MYKPAAYEYLAQDRVIYGRPAVDVVVEEADRRQAQRIFVVSAHSLVEKTDEIDKLKTALGERFVGLFHQTVAHTPRPTVIACADAVRAVDADLIVTVGGGTPIDTVKAVLVALAHDVRSEAQLANYRITVDADGRPVFPPVKSPPLRQIIVPTTLSGAEFSNLAGVTDPVRQVKDGFTGREIGGAAVIIDPALTRHTPDALWLSTGIRAVDHAVETICTPHPSPLPDAGALHALRLFVEALPRTAAAAEDGTPDLDARLDAQLAVWLACMGLNRVPYGASHGIGHQLGAVAAVPHGYCSCVMLPSVMRYNRSVTADRQAMIAAAMGRPGDDAADVVEALVQRLGLPTRLRDVGVKEDQLDQIAAGSLGNFMVRANPRRITEAGQVREILDLAW